jgi:hypothetical protein
LIILCSQRDSAGQRNTQDKEYSNAKGTHKNNNMTTCSYVVNKQEIRQAQLSRWLFKKTYVCSVSRHKKICAIELRGFAISSTCSGASPGFSGVSAVRGT